MSNRTIKCRAKILATTEWIYGAPLKKGSDWVMLHIDTSGNLTLSLINPDTIGEWIGLTDKKGVDIYENDIIRIYTLWNEDFKEEDHLPNEYTNHVVKYGIDHDYPAFDLSPSSGADCNGLSDMVCNDEYEHYEVIGNTTDNPELIPAKYLP